MSKRSEVLGEHFYRQASLMGEADVERDKVKDFVQEMCHPDAFTKLVNHENWDEPTELMCQVGNVSNAFLNFESGEISYDANLPGVDVESTVKHPFEESDLPDGAYNFGFKTESAEFEFDG